jgi:hypothetical protein
VGEGEPTYDKKDNKKKACNGTEGETTHLQGVQEKLFAAVCHAFARNGYLAREKVILTKDVDWFHNFGCEPLTNIPSMNIHLDKVFNPFPISCPINHDDT